MWSWSPEPLRRQPSRVSPLDAPSRCAAIDEAGQCLNPGTHLLGIGDRICSVCAPHALVLTLACRGAVTTIGDPS